MERQLTPTQFWMQYGYKPYEFVDGHAVRRPKLRLVESVVLLRVSALIEQYAAENDLGEMVNGVGFTLAPDTIRSPRAAFIAKAQWDSISQPYSPFPFAPTLILEVDTDTEADPERSQLYLRAGTAQVWRIQTQSQQVTVELPHAVPQVYDVGQVLSGGRVLPGFLLPVASLFPKSRHF